MIDEGYIKFDCNWTKTAPLSSTEIKELNFWRDKMYAANVIGAFDNGIGFGNISQRVDGNQFIISGSATGNFKKLNNTHYAKVIAFDIAKNQVNCIGPTKASSESMSHAVVYQTCPNINVVIHIHHLALWKKLLHNIPTTSVDATYGSPEMAEEIIRLLKIPNTLEIQFLAMAGHEEGLISFGETFEEAADVIYKYLNQLV